jgi:fibronectin-binding autotransporter adhesin
MTSIRGGHGCRGGSGLRALRVLISLAALLALARGAAAQTTVAATDIGSGGIWDVGSTWSCPAGPTPCVPNDSASDVFDVAINSGTVILNTPAATQAFVIDTLAVASAATLQEVGGASLTVQSGAVNAGTTDVDNAGAGGSVLTVNGTLVNSGTVNLGNASLTAPTEIIATGLSNTGTVSITGTVTVQTLMDLTGQQSANPLVSVGGELGAGTYHLTNDAVLEYGGPGISVIGPGVTVDLSGAGASLDDAGLTADNAATANTNSALDTLATNVGTLDLANGASVVTNSGLGLVNTGTINVDQNTQTSSGGSDFGVGGLLTNNGQITIGNGQHLTSAVTASVGGLLDNTGTLSVHGNITLAAPVSASLAVAGGAFSAGIPTQAFTAVNSGTVNLESAASVSVSGTYQNLGTTNVDTLTDYNYTTGKSYSGGSVLDVAGVLGNSGYQLAIGASTVSLGGGSATLNLGNASLTLPTEIMAAGLNNLGTINITGTPGVQALLDLTGPAAANPFVQPPGILDAGAYNLTSDAVLEYSGPGISGIATGVTVNLNGAGASIASTSLIPNNAATASTNSALDTLAGNAGTLALANGASVATNPGLDLLNTATLDVDESYGGGSTLAVGGTLENAHGATLDVGNGTIGKSSTVTAGGFSNYGTLNLIGTTTSQAALELTGAASAAPFVPASGVLGSGTYNLTNEAAIDYAGPGITEIGPGVTVSLNGAPASISATGLTPETASGTNSGFETLAANAGTLQLNNGGSLSTNPGLNLVNSGSLQLGAAGQDGASVDIGGTLSSTFDGELIVGNGNLAKPTTVTVNGSLDLYTGAATGCYEYACGPALLQLSGAPAVQATLAVTGAAPATLTGIYELSGDALLEYGSGGIDSIGGGFGLSSLTLVGPNALIALAGSTTTSSALAGLSMNGGSLTLASGAQVATDAGVNFVNSGSVSVDGASGAPGGSALGIGGTIQSTEAGTLAIGNGGMSSPSSVTAAGFALDTLAGNVTVTGRVPGTGNATAALILTNGLTGVGAGSSLTISNANAFVALAGASPLGNSGLTTLTSNEGMLTFADGTQVATAPGLEFDNGRGTVTVDAGAQTAGTTSFTIGGVLDNGASFEIDNRTVTGSSAASVTAAGLNNFGTIGLAGAASSHTVTLTVNGNAVNAGTIDIGGGVGATNFATVALTGSGVFTQEAGLTGAMTDVDGTLSAGSVDIAGGLIEGGGTVNASVLNAGFIRGGEAGIPAGLAISGNYSQTPSGVLYQPINGTSSGQFGSLNVGGNVTAGGLLAISSPAYGFAFAQGQSFDILNITSTTGKISGTFAGLEYDGMVSSGPELNIGNGLGLQLTYNSNDVVLSVVGYTAPASADSWNAGAGTWNTASGADWSAGSIPSSASDVVLGGSTGGSVTLDPTVSGTTVNSLTVTNGYTLAYGAPNESLATSTAVNVDAGGALDLQNSGDTLATGRSGGDGNLTSFGTLSLAGGAAASVGGALSNFGTLSVESGAALTVNGDFVNGAPGGLSLVPGSGPSDLATASFEAAGISTISGNLTNYDQAALNIDEQYQVTGYDANGFPIIVGGGSTLNVGGTLSNAGNLTIGSAYITSPVSVNVGSLLNTGSLSLLGAMTPYAAAPANVAAAINVSGGWVPSSGILASGSYTLTGDAQINYAGAGIGTIDSRAAISLTGAAASISDSAIAANGIGVNNALDTLGNVAGSLELVDGAQVQTDPGVNLTDSGSVQVDTTGFQGGSTLTVGGTLIVQGSAQLAIGSFGTLPGTVNVAGLYNAGAVALTGCATAGCAPAAVLNVTGSGDSFIPASGALNQGDYYLTGNASINYSGAAVTSIGSGVIFDLSGAGASINDSRLSPDNGATNSALDRLASNAGSLEVAGASVQTDAGVNLANSGSIAVGDGAAATGGQSGALTVGGALENSGLISVAGATLTADGFSNSGMVQLAGSQTSAALLDITGTAAVDPFVSVAGALSPGIYDITNDAQLEYSGPGISSIPNGAAILITGPFGTSFTDSSLPALTATGVNSAFDTLSANAGTLMLDQTQASTSASLVNSGSILVQAGEISVPTSGGNQLVYAPASLSVAGAFTNTNAADLQLSPCGITVVGVCISSGGTLSAASLDNSGAIEVSGATNTPAPAPSTLSTSGPATNSGSIELTNSGQLSVGGTLTNTGTGTLSLGQSSGSPAVAVTAGAVENAGAVTISGGNGAYALAASLTVTGSGSAYTQTGPLASTTVAGTLTAPTVNLQGGLLQGNGTINGNVVNGATMLASTSLPYGQVPGVLTIKGNYSQTAGGVLDELVQGAVTPGSQYGVIDATGAVSLAGALDLTTLNGFSLAANQSYDLMNFTPGTLTGTFGTLEYRNIAASGSGTSLLNLGNQLALSLQYDNSTGQVLLDVVSAQPPPTYDNWTGASDTWSSPVNWSTGQTPLPSQDVYVGTGCCGTVTYDETASSVNSLTVEEGTTGTNPLYALSFGAGDTLNVAKTVTVATGGQLLLMASGAALTAGGDFTNDSALYVSDGATVTVGSAASAADFINNGSTVVDGRGVFVNNLGYAASPGGSVVAISGTLTNNGALSIGDALLNTTNPAGITSQATVSAASLSTTSGGGLQADTLGGIVDIAGENPALGSAPAVLQLGTSITSIAAGAQLTLENQNSFITTDTSGPFSNNGISALSSIGRASLLLEAGASATVADTLANAGNIELDTTFDTGSTTAPYADLPTTLNVAGLDNTGAIDLYGCATAGCTAQALIDVTGPAGAFIPASGSLNTGAYALRGDSAIQYNGPGIGSIGSGVYVTLTSANGLSPSIEAASLVPNNGLTNSAFNTLTSNAGHLQLGGGSIVTNAGLDLTNSGYIEVLGGSLVVGGALINTGGAPTDLGVDVSEGTLAAAGLSNSGSFGSFGVGATALTINGAASNSGLLTIGGGANVSGTLTNAAGGQLGVGGYTVQGEFTGAGSSDLNAGAVSNSGAVAIYAYNLPGGTSTSSTLTVTGSGNAYTQSGPSASTLVEGSLLAPAVNIEGGILQGTGTVAGAVTNGAAVAGGTGAASPGLLTITGSYTQTSGGTLDEIVAGATTRGSSYSAIDISGAAALDGTLNVSAVNGFTFAPNESLDILNFAPNQLSGSFSTLQYGSQTASGSGLIDLGSDTALAVAYNGSSGQVLLEVVTPDNWTGGSGNWSTGSWSVGQPGQTQRVVIGTGPGGTVTLDQSASIYDLNLLAASAGQGIYANGYTLAFNPSETLTTAGGVSIGSGGEIDLEAAGAVLNAGGDVTLAGSANTLVGYAYPGTLHLENGGVVNVGTPSEPRNLDNAGTILVDSGQAGDSALNVSGTLSNAGGLIALGNPGITAASTLTAAGFAGNALTGTVQLEGNGSAGGAAATLELGAGISSIAADSGLLLLNSSSQVDLAGATGSNSGLASLSDVAGTLQLESGSAVATGGALTIDSGGTVAVDETASTAGGSALTIDGTLANAGTFELGTGGGAAAIVSDASVSGLSNSGTATIGGGHGNEAFLTVNGAAANSGTLTIASGAEVNVTGSNAYVQSAGATNVNGALIASSVTLDGGTLTANGSVGAPVTINGGTLQGVGYIGSDVSNVGGAIDATPGGFYNGTLTIHGSYTQGAGGTFDVLLSQAPYSPLTSGVLNVIGTGSSVTLGGTLDVSAASTSGYTAVFTVGQSFDILNAPANELFGTFSALSCSGLNCVPSNNSGLILVSQTGQPGSPDLGLLPVYEPSAGEVLLNVITPPATAVSWPGGSGNWSDAAAWNNEGFTPMGYQDVTLGSGAGGTVTYDETSASVNSLAVGTGTGSGYTLSFNPATALSVATTVSVASGGEVDVAAVGASLASAGNLSNDGTLTVANGGSLIVGSLLGQANLTNSPAGAVNVDAGTSTGGSSVAVLGNLSNEGVVDIGNGNLTAPTEVDVIGLQNDGALELSGGSATATADLNVAGAATNSLSVSVGSFANLTVRGSGNAYTQECPGQLCLASTTVNGTLTAPAVDITAGVLQGVGTINGAVTNGGLVAGGSYLASTPGTLTIDGSYTQTSAGILAETLVAGPSAPVHSVLDVTGPVALDGTLQIDALNGLTLAPGQTFDIMNFTPGALAGEFATLADGSFSGSGAGLVSIGSNLDVSMSYDNAAGDLLLTVGALDSWNGTTDLWSGANDAGNWSTGASPTAAEDVLIGAGSGGTVTFNESSGAAQSLTVQPGTGAGYTLAFDAGDALAVSKTVSIDQGAAIDLEANGATLTTGGDFSNAGTLTLGQDTQSGQGGTAGEGATVTVGSPSAPGDFTNKGSIIVDAASAASPALPTGGSTLTITGALDDSGGTIDIGNAGITSESLVSAASLSATSGTKTLANTLDGTVIITGEDPTKGKTAAVLEVATAITGIAKSGSLTLSNSNAFITTDTSGPFSNDGLAALASNQGSLTLENGAQADIGAASLANKGSVTLDGGAGLTLGSSQSLSNLVNSGSLEVGTGTGGSTLTVNGMLDDTQGTVTIGSAGITSADTMTIQSFAAVGQSGTEAPSTALNGTVTITGSGSGGATATLDLGSALTDIAAGASLTLGNARSFVNVSNDVGNDSGLTSLTDVHGTLALESGASVTDSGGLSVASGGTVGVDESSSTAGGSSLTVNGTLSNAGTFDVGSGGSGAGTIASNVSASGLDNSGTAAIGGANSKGVVLTINGAASNSGAITIAGGGQLEVTGGNPLNQSAGSLTIASGGSLSAASFTQTGGTTLVNGTLTAPTGGITVNGGTLAGTGTIAASVSNTSGTVAASADGASPGTLALNGSYTQGSGATLDEFIGGASAGTFSAINLTGGSLSLAGTLAVSTVNGFALAGGQSFDIINFPAGSLSGTFGKLAYGGVVGSGTSPLDVENGTLALSVQYGGNGNNEVILKVTSVATSDVWKANSGDWYDPSNDATDWSTQSPPTQPSISPPQSPQDVLIGEGSTGGTVTLGACGGLSGCGSNPNVTEVKSLTVEANPNVPGANYVLDVSGGVTLTVDKTTAINQGGEIDLQAAGATLTSGGSMSNGGTLTLANGGSVTVGTASAPANFTNTAGASAGTINVDTTGNGGSTLTVNGTLTNDTSGTLGTINIGNANLTANATVSAQGSGSLDGTLDITAPGASAPLVTLTLSTTTPYTLAATVTPSTTAQAALSLSTTPVTSILNTGSVTLSGANAFVEMSGAGGTNSALTGLTSNAGKLELDGGAQVITGVDGSGNPTTATLSNTGSITTAKGTTFSSNGNLIVAGTGGLSNSGTITVNGDTAVQDLNGEFVQSGSGASTTVTGAGARLQVLAVNAGVGMDLQDGTLNVQNGGFVCVGTGSSGCNGFITKSIGRDLTMEGSSTINIDSSSTMNVSGSVKKSGGNVQINGTLDPVSYVQSGGTTEVGGTLVSPMVDVEGGSLSGGGGIQGNLVNNALVSPGASSHLTVAGNYTQGANGTLLIDILSLTDFSSLDVTGNASLDGTVEFDFLNGYVPQANDTFAFLDAASVTGDFSSFDFAGIDCVSCTAGFNGTDLTFSLDTGSVSPTSTTPEPGPLGLLATGLLALGWMLRRKRPGAPRARTFSSCNSGRRSLPPAAWGAHARSVGPRPGSPPRAVDSGF